MKEKILGKDFVLDDTVGTLLSLNGRLKEMKAHIEKNKYSKLKNSTLIHLSIITKAIDNYEDFLRGIQLKHLTFEEQIEEDIDD